MTPEGRIQKQLKTRVAQTGGRFRKLKWIGRRSALDTLVWWPGAPPSMAFIEVKVGNSPYQPGQEREIERLRADGFNAFTVRTFDDIEMVINILRPLFRDIECA